MFSFKPLSHKFKCALMGLSLGLAAVILYIGFLLAHQMTDTDQMVLIPIQLEASSQGVK
jgi:predicted alpha/beta-fold hydrolase